LLPEVIPMPAPARKEEPEIETLSLEERINRRAYELYVQRGNQSGSEFDDCFLRLNHHNGQFQNVRSTTPQWIFPVAFEPSGIQN